MRNGSKHSGTGGDVKHLSLLWADPDRAGEIAALHQQLFDPPWSEDSIRVLLEHPAAASLVAIAGPQKTMAGFVMAQLAADEVEILSIGVAPEFHKRGVGRKLLEGLVRAMQRAEATRLFLEVADDNMAAQALYRGMGFTEAGRRKAYYERSGGPAADALILALKL